MDVSVINFNLRQAIKLGILLCWWFKSCRWRGHIMQLKSQADIDWFGWSFLWILTRQMLGICLRLHFYELTPASDNTVKETSAYADAHLHRLKEQPAQLSHKDKAEPNNWFYQDFRMNIHWMWAAYFPCGDQRYLLWYRGRLLIKLADIEGFYRQTESRAEEFEEQPAQSGVCGGWHYVFLLQHLIYSFIWATFVRNTSCCCRAFSAL